MSTPTGPTPNDATPSTDAAEPTEVVQDALTRAADATDATDATDAAEGATPGGTPSRDGRPAASGRVVPEAEFSGPPLLEYDPDPIDLISDARRGSHDLRLPERAVLTLLRDASPRWAAEHGWRQVYTVETITMDFPIWVGEHRGVEMALAEVPLGGPAAAIVAEELFMGGVRTAVATGSCGGLVHFEEGEFVLPTKALRDEGTSYRYLPPTSRWVETDPDVRDACKRAVDQAGLSWVEAPTWTTDGFFRETRGSVAARRSEGCHVVDMECASLAACARFRGVRYAQILYTADTLAGDAHDPRTWGDATRTVALGLALDAAALA